jgi:hypothetical protein
VHLSVGDIRPVAEEHGDLALQRPVGPLRSRPDPHVDVQAVVPSGPPRHVPRHGIHVGRGAVDQQRPPTHGLQQLPAGLTGGGIAGRAQQHHARPQGGRVGGLRDHRHALVDVDAAGGGRQVSLVPLPLLEVRAVQVVPGEPDLRVPRGDGRERLPGLPRHPPAVGERRVGPAAGVPQDPAPAGPRLPLGGLPVPDVHLQVLQTVGIRPYLHRHPVVPCGMDRVERTKRAAARSGLVCNRHRTVGRETMVTTQFVSHTQRAGGETSSREHTHVIRHVGVLGVHQMEGRPHGLRRFRTGSGHVPDPSARTHEGWHDAPSGLGGEEGGEGLAQAPGTHLRLLDLEVLQAGHPIPSGILHPAHKEAPLGSDVRL